MIAFHVRIIFVDSALGGQHFAHVLAKMFLDELWSERIDFLPVVSWLPAPEHVQEMLRYDPTIQFGSEAFIIRFFAEFYLAIELCPSQPNQQLWIKSVSMK